MQYPEFVKIQALAKVNEEIVDPIRQRMEKAGYSKKISQQVRAEIVTIDTDGFVDIDIISDYEADGFDVADFMEKGRRRFFVKPKIKKALHWIFQGLSRFSGGHWIPERFGDRFVEEEAQTGEQRAQQKLNLETDDFLQRNLS